MIDIGPKALHVQVRRLYIVCLPAWIALCVELFLVKDILDFSWSPLISSQQLGI